MTEHPASAAIEGEEVNFLDAPVHPGVLTLAAYWEEKRGGHAMPDRSSIDPTGMLRILPNIFICEVLDAGREFRFRIFGTALVNFFHLEMTGKTLADFGHDASIITNVGGAERRWRRIIDATFQKAAPVFTQGHLINTLRRNHEWHGYSAPLTTGGEGIGQILGGLFLTDDR